MKIFFSLTSFSFLMRIVNEGNIWMPSIVHGFSVLPIVSFFVNFRRFLLFIVLGNTLDI